MNADTLRALLQQVADGATSPDAALDRLRTLPFAEAAQTLADTHREIRSGLPEVVFGRQKTAEQITEALAALQAAHGHALATQVSPDVAATLMKKFTQGRHDPASSLFAIGSMKPRTNPQGVAVVCAGTSDLPVAEEAAQTLEFAGANVQRVRDVGVAGLHRLLAKLELIRESRVVIAIAGMEGALPGVVAGLVAAPVIAVPTSVGYGASFGGLSALLSMLNACASGIGVVNIDNGFGAAVLALRILNTQPPT
jgi:pyridinium-3,5-biscarboxylic acid mononucleotide synthase